MLRGGGAEHFVDPGSLAGYAGSRQARRTTRRRIFSAPAQALRVWRGGAAHIASRSCWRWDLCNFHSEHVRYVPEHDALIVAEQAGSTLLVYDVARAVPPAGAAVRVSSPCADVRRPFIGHAAAAFGRRQNSALRVPEQLGDHHVEQAFDWSTTRVRQIGTARLATTALSYAAGFLHRRTSRGNR